MCIRDSPHPRYHATSIFEEVCWLLVLIRPKPTHATKLRTFLKRVCQNFDLYQNQPPPTLPRYKHFWRGTLAASLDLTQTNPRYKATNLSEKGIFKFSTFNITNPLPRYHATSIFEEVCWLLVLIRPKPTHATKLRTFLKRVCQNFDLYQNQPQPTLPRYKHF